MFSTRTIALAVLALGACALPMTAVAEDNLVLCIKKIGKTNNRGRDIYLSRNGRCRFPLYTTVDLGDATATAVGPQGPVGAKGDQGEPGFVDVTSCYKKVVSNYDQSSSSSSDSSSSNSSSSNSSSLPGVALGEWDYGTVRAYCDDPTQEFVLESGWRVNYYNVDIYSDEPLFNDENGNTWSYPVGREVSMSDYWDRVTASCKGYDCYPELSVTISCCRSGQTVAGTQPTPTAQ